MNTAIAHDHGKHPLTLSHPLSNKCADSFPGILLPSKLIICIHSNPQHPAQKFLLSDQQDLAESNVAAPTQVHTHVYGNRKLGQLRSVCHEPLWFSTRDENWCFKPSSSATASSGLQWGVPSAHSPWIQAAHTAQTSSQFVWKSWSSVELNPAPAAEGAHSSDTQHCAHVTWAVVTHTPLPAKTDCRT